MPVHGFCGLPGAGKTYTAVKHVRKLALHYKKPIFSNVELHFPEKSIEVHVMDDLDDFLKAKDGIVLLDELGTWMPSRLYTKTKADLLMRWAQVRKYQLYEILWTAQTVARVDTVVRELTWDLLDMESFRMLGFFFGRKYAGAMSNRQKIGVEFHWVDKKVYGWYDTMAIVKPPSNLSS